MTQHPSQPLKKPLIGKQVAVCPFQKVYHQVSELEPEYGRSAAQR
jgi:hypothetical protein